MRMPVRVLAEFSKHAPHAFSTTVPAWSPSPRFQQRHNNGPRPGNNPQLHSGESEALALAEEFKANSSHGRRGGATHGRINVDGSARLARSDSWCAAQHLISKADAELHLTNLESSSPWLSPRVRAEACTAVAKLFAS